MRKVFKKLHREERNPQLSCLSKLKLKRKSFFPNSVDLLYRDYLEMVSLLTSAEIPNALNANAIMWTLNKHASRLQMSFAHNMKDKASDN